MEIKNFIKYNDYCWGLKKKRHTSMQVDAKIFATESILKCALEDGSINQVINVASLPNIQSPSLALPDIHYGYGFCIGGVGVFPVEKGIILPGGVGYDINCGVRLVATDLQLKDIDHRQETLGNLVLSQVPTGLTSKSILSLNQKEFQNILSRGAEEIVKNYAGEDTDLQFIESRGNLEFNSPEVISHRAMERGIRQVGSLGSGNHFIEIQQVTEIYDAQAARAFGLKKNTLSIMIHTGSRGFGHQVASDYIEIIRKRNLSKIKVKDPQLIYAELSSREGQNYLAALNAASNFAWANRHLIMEKLIDILQQTFSASRKEMGIHLVYDQSHNIAKFETHRINNKPQNMLVHRKGATRAFPPGHPDLPPSYGETGQPVIIPGSMGTASYLLKGTPEAMNSTFGSSAHGAGRKLSRKKAVKISQGMNIRHHLKKENIYVFSFSDKGLMEEVPQAYKEIDEIVAVTDKSGISTKVAKMIPVIVIKG